MSSMLWSKSIWTKSNDGDGPKWISGIYKVVRYERSLSDRLGVHYRAYYIRGKSKCWGYYVDAGTPYYLSLKEAQTACEKHSKEMHDQVTTR